MTLSGGQGIALNYAVISDYILFSCCNASRPMLNNAQEAAASSGSKTTRSLVSAIKVKLRLQIITFLISLGTIIPLL